VRPTVFLDGLVGGSHHRLLLSTSWHERRRFFTMGRKSNHRRDVLDRQADRLAPFLVGLGERAVMCPLCLGLYPESCWADSKLLTIEHAPVKQYQGGTQRCMTCSCNGAAGRSFENDIGILRDRRREALLAALQAQPRYLSPVEAIGLLAVRPEERLAELKSAYVVAFATLGHSYVLGPGLDQVRALLDPGANLPVPRVCGLVTGLPPGDDKVYVTDSAVFVSQPNCHTSKGDGHVVYLPLPHSELGFYDRTNPGGSSRTRFSGTGRWIYDQPPARRLEMHWDADDHHHELRCNGTVNFEADDGQVVAVELGRCPVADLAD
jgi:hypothetical protein